MKSLSLFFLSLALALGLMQPSFADVIASDESTAPPLAAAGLLVILLIAVALLVRYFTKKK